jgi:hypothetical protein
MSYREGGNLLKLVFLSITIVLASPPMTEAQVASSRPPSRYEVGLGIGRLAERFCSFCRPGPRTIGPALLIRVSRATTRLLEVAGELQATAGGGRAFEAALASIALTSVGDRLAWLRVGFGVLAQPGQGDDVALSGQSSAEREGTEVVPGFALGIGLDIPVSSHRSLNPQLSYVGQLDSRRRFSLVTVGVGLRFF